MRRVSFIAALGLLVCGSMWAQNDDVSTPTAYSYQDVNYPGDTFTQLLGINNEGVIAGYHNVNANSGFTLVLPSSYTTENYPSAAMTQVIGINNTGVTVGFYVDKAGKTHSFRHTSKGYLTDDDPKTLFNQFLGQNDEDQAVGYYSMSLDNTTPDFPYIHGEGGTSTFAVLSIPGAVGGAQATGINNAGDICGFYIDVAGVNHGFYLQLGFFTKLNYPGSTGTQALGLNNAGEIVGFYTDSVGNTHGFLYNVKAKTWQSLDDPNGIGTTVVNGINDKHQLVGFWGTPPLNTGFVANPQ